jgi:integrase
MRSTLVFYPNHRKKSPKTAKIPIYLRVLHNGKAESRLNAEITEEEMKRWNPIQMKLEERNSYVNEMIDTINVEFRKFQSLNPTNLSQYSAAQIRDILLYKEEKTEIEIYEYCKRYYENAIVPKRDISDGTKKNYLKALKHLEKFNNYKGLQKLKICDLSINYVNMLWDYLLADIPILKKKGMTEVSASGVFKKFKTIFDRAVNEERLSKNHFKSIKSKNRSPQRLKMTMSQITSWQKVDLANFSSFELFKDFYLFSFYTGLAYSDLMSLNKSHLLDISKNQILLKKNRRKTNELIEVVLVSYAKDLIEKYKVHPEVIGTEKIFPKRSLRSLNYYYQMIADRLGFQMKITSHIARHTYRQALNEAGITEPEIIKRMMGQSNGNSIDSVYFAINEKNLSYAKNKFQSFLNKMFRHDKH